MHLGRRTATAILMIGMALGGATAPFSTAQADANSSGTGSVAASTGGSGSAAGSEVSRWSRLAGLVPHLHGTRESVSCTNLSHCTAVDNLGRASVFTGTKWKRLRPADRHLGPLASVSCPTSTFCAAVGGVREIVEKKGAWRRVHVAPSNLTSVSCWAASRCRAVGDDGTTMRYDGRWHRGPDAATPDLSAVSCTSRRFCMAMTSTGASYRFHHGRWTAKGAALPDIRCSSVPPTEACVGEEVVSLDCPTARLCLAATGLTWVARWDGSTWRKKQLEPDRIAVSAAVSCSGPSYCAWMTRGGDFAVWRHGWSAVTHHHHVGGGDAYPPAFDCPRAGRCVMVGGLTTTTIRPGLRFHRSATKPAQHIHPYVDCPTAGTCVSVNDVFRAREFHRGRWAALASRHFVPGGPINCATRTFCATPGVTWNGATWKRSAGWPNADVWSVDCVSATYCLAAGLYDDGDNPNEVWDGTTWSAIPESLESVAAACGAASDCWTLSSSGFARHWDGTSWSPSEQLFSTVDGHGIACPSADFCLAWNHEGEVVYLRNGVWGDGEQLAPMVDVSCASPTSCVGMLRDRPAFDATYDGQSWTVARALPRGYGGTITDISCVGQDACMAVDREGNALRRTS